jgi:anaerobic nitric oxide reductase transcription regulator
MDTVKILTDIALDLTAALDARSRYLRLLTALRRAIPYDAAALMRLEGDVLVIKATVGLAEDAESRHFFPADHPRLDIICKSLQPFVFPADTDLPDPFDGLLAVGGAQHHRIHSCLGCPLYAGGRLIGLLTADAVDPKAFDLLDHTFIQAIAALAGAEMHTTDLLQALELSARKMDLIARDLVQEVRRDKGEAMIGRSPALNRLRREIDLVARSDFSVLITGETGVGKELVALAIHAASRRRDQPLLSVNCANLVEALAESELFGHSKGAFTGATDERTGKFELADGGTLFLDEIGELPLAVQPKLLRVLQVGEVEKLGTSRLKKVDVRLLAATNRNLEQEVAVGRFRADLFHRLNVYPLRVPPLRERLEDLPLLAGYFCQAVQRRLGTGTISLSSEALMQLKGYHWPGNVRELENLIIRAAIKASAKISPYREIDITPEVLDIQGSAGEGTAESMDDASAGSIGRAVSLKEAVDTFKKTCIRRALAAHGGNWAAAARSLGLHRSNLHKLAGRLNSRE